MHNWYRSPKWLQPHYKPKNLAAPWLSRDVMFTIQIVTALHSRCSSRRTSFLEVRRKTSRPVIPIDRDRSPLFAGARTFKYANIEAQWLRLSPGHQHAWFNMDIIHFIPEIYSVMWALAFPYINNRVTTYFLTFTGLACKFLDQSFKWRCISLPAICRYIRYLLNGARKVEVCIIISANTLGKRGQLGICWIFACLCVLRIN